MLYVTTRNKSDAYTAHNTLTRDRGADGGLFVPFQLPQLSNEDIRDLKNKTFGQCVADILNMFFSARLDGWDVDFSIGRYPSKLVPMNHKMIIGEIWHNPDWDFARMVRNLASRIRGNDDTEGVPSNWAWIAIRIATLFGLYGELLRQGMADPEKKLDVSVNAGDFGAPISLWYAREMGLPLGTIICACNENSAVWDLLYHGSLRTDTLAISTNTPENDVSIPVNLERLICGILGHNEAVRFHQCCEEGRAYTPEEDCVIKLRKGIYSAVVSSNRMESIIFNVYRSSTYLLGPYSALAYGALQDFRTGVGESRAAMILTERGPICSAAIVAKSLGITVQDLKERVSKR